MRLKWVLCTLVGLALLPGAGFAASIDCRNVATSAGPAPAELIAACGSHRQLGPPAFDPSDVAVSPDGILASCSSMTLNNPGSTAQVGFVDFRPACDFAGDDFTKLYCYTFDVPGSLSSIDPSTCSETFIGTGNNNRSASGMAWDDSTGTMYLSTTDVVTSNLYTVNLATGGLTLVGGMGSASPANIAIAVDSSGAFGPLGQMYGYDIVNDSLQSIDKTTGLATTIGPLGFDANFAQGMDFDESDGTCYIFAFNNTTFTGQLRTCNISTGSTTLVGTIGAGFEEWTGPGIMAGGGGGCTLTVSAVQTGGNDKSLAVNMSVQHRRGKTVRVPFVITVRDALGNQMLSRTTKSFKLGYGKEVQAKVSLPVGGFAPGVYTVSVSMNEMRGGREVATTQVTIR